MVDVSVAEGHYHKGGLYVCDRFNFHVSLWNIHPFFFSR